MSSFTLETVSALKAELKARQDQLDPNHATRLHRAISWLKCAEEADNADLEFISLWISLNACFAIDRYGDQPLSDHDQFHHFIELLALHDTGSEIYSCLWEEYSGHVKALIKNPYVFHAFWQSKRNGDDNWQGEFDRSSLQALNALSRQRVADLCTIVLDRLFVLRNQLIYGGATYKGKVNRQQVEDGAGLLGSLMPVIIKIMLKAADEDWGEVAYPVING
ncbi:HEPN domain-containing protein [Reinekea marinisedimentorum]|uniref:Uncharacterized protein n=1 Tax=Reinekea marinisedimentorum TaxID=230495 RepID=A0A4R3IBM5_9GAMM|nr:HEPN domain-containing protein [Reinekea marinisedimentorum]TCS42681.1 hypothetical protein BCF53_103350 [Reinekea marinisedimentorum]